MEKNDIKHIRKLLKSGKTVIALTELEKHLDDMPATFSKDLVLLFAQSNQNDEQYRQGLLQYDDYSRYKARIDKTFLTLLDEIDELVDDKEQTNRNQFSKEIISEYLKYGVDLGVLSEIKGEIIQDVKVDTFYHFLKVKGEDLFQEFHINGYNMSRNDVSHLSFSAEATVPSLKKNMEISGYCNINQKRLGVTCDEDDQNAVKKLKLFFASPLKQNEVFDIKCSFKLERTMLVSGKDFILSSTSYQEKVDKYKLKLEIEDMKPEYIKLININTNKETLLFEDNGFYEVNLSSNSAKYLNQLNLLLLFER